MFKPIEELEVEQFKRNADFQNLDELFYPVGVDKNENYDDYVASALKLALNKAYAASLNCLCEEIAVLDRKLVVPFYVADEVPRYNTAGWSGRSYDYFIVERDDCKTNLISLESYSDYANKVEELKKQFDYDNLSIQYEIKQNERENSLVSRLQNLRRPKLKPPPTETHVEKLARYERKTRSDEVLDYGNRR